MSQEQDTSTVDDAELADHVQNTIDADAAREDAPPTAAVPEPSGLANKLVGSVLSWVAVVLFYLTCMFLPLVGQAGKTTPYAGKNMLTFLIVVVLALIVSVVALLSRLKRRRAMDVAGSEFGGGFPWIQAVLVAVNLVVLLLLFTGSLGI